MTDELLSDFEASFDEMRKRLGFTSTLDDLDVVFFLRDQAVQQGAVPPRIDRWTCHRICETFWSWNHFLHRLVMPNPGSMFETTEAGDMDPEHQPSYIDLMTRIMALVSRNTVLGVSKDIKGQSAFIDEALALWNDISPELTTISEQVTSNWQRRSATPSPR